MTVTMSEPRRRLGRTHRSGPRDRGRCEGAPAKARDLHPQDHGKIRVGSRSSPVSRATTLGAVLARPSSSEYRHLADSPMFARPSADYRLARSGEPGGRCGDAADAADLFEPRPRTRSRAWIADPGTQGRPDRLCPGAFVPPGTAPRSRARGTKPGSTNRSVRSRGSLFSPPERHTESHCGQVDGNAEPPDGGWAPHLQIPPKGRLMHPHRPPLGRRSAPVFRFPCRPRRKSPPREVLGSLAAHSLRDYGPQLTVGDEARSGDASSSPVGGRRLRVSRRRRPTSTATIPEDHVSEELRRRHGSRSGSRRSYTVSLARRREESGEPFSLDLLSRQPGLVTISLARPGGTPRYGLISAPN